MKSCSPQKVRHFLGSDEGNGWESKKIRAAAMLVDVNLNDEPESHRGLYAYEGDGGNVSNLKQQIASAPPTPTAARHQITVANAVNNNVRSSDSSSSSNPQFPQTAKRTSPCGNYRTMNLYEGIFACFRPVISYFATSKENLSVHPMALITSSADTLPSLTGAVFSGMWNSRMVAVKKVKEKSETDIHHLRHLDHDNIIKFLGVCTQSTEKPIYAIVMEYCSRGQLCEVLKADVVIPYREWVEWARQIADGMEYLHKNKVIHRDLKSPNILVTESNVIRISDFGTSHLQKKTNPTQMSFVGTVNWMPPEMIHKEPCSEKVDIWSYGVVLWELLTREQPYKNIDTMAILFGVGSNVLSLPIPVTAPDGLKLLIRQCWSQKPRNRPSFTNILQHLSILKSELEEMGEEEWTRRAQLWREEARRVEYPSSINKHGAKRMQMEIQSEKLREKRENELKHAMEIRELYEIKLQRVNRMYSQLTNCLAHVQEKEEEITHREQLLEERCLAVGLARQRVSSFTALQKQRPVVVRAGPRAMRGEPQESSSEDEEEQASLSGISSTGAYTRGSAFRCSQASSSSGFVPSSASMSFSRQSSSRSSGARDIKVIEPALHGTPPRPARCLSRELSTRQSGSSLNQPDFLRGSPARGSTMSEDYAAAGNSSIYRNVDGRWSDGRLVKRRQARKPFQRDSPARAPSVRSRDQQRLSFPLGESRNSPVRVTENRQSLPLGESTRSPSGTSLSRCSISGCGDQDEYPVCHCPTGAVSRNTRAQSMVVQPTATIISESSSYSSTATEYALPCTTSQPEAIGASLVELNVAKLPSSTSYDEALRSRVSQDSAVLSGHRCSGSREHFSEEREVSSEENPVHEYSNPLYRSPVSTHPNPTPSISQSTPTSPISKDATFELNAKTNLKSGRQSVALDDTYLKALDPNTDLFSSLDSNNPQQAKEGSATTKRASDASAESSSDEEEKENERNGNLLESSLDSSHAEASFDRRRTSDEMDPEHFARAKMRREEILLDSSLSMASSLERSLEMGARRSDGLSDQERNVRAVKNTLKGHRRTHSNPQTRMMVIVDETSSESDAVEC